VVVLVDWAGEEAIVDWVGVLEDWAGTMVNGEPSAGALEDWTGTMVNEEPSAGALVVWVDMAVARADVRPPLATGPGRVSEGTLCSVSSHCIVKSKNIHTPIGQRTLAQEIVNVLLRACCAVVKLVAPRAMPRHSRQVAYLLMKSG